MIMPLLPTRHPWRLQLLAAALVAAMAGAVVANGPAAANGPGRAPGAALVTPVDAAPLKIVTASGTHAFAVEVRDTPEGRAVGLMHRPAMPEGQGMLFDFEQTMPIDMWMKNTLLPLDMIFIRPDGGIASIAAHTKPLSTRIIPSGEPVRYVLELNAGAAERIGARPGDRVAHPLIAGD